MIDIEAYRQWHAPREFADPLLHGPKNDEFADLLDQIVAERRSDLMRDVDLDAT
jgi:hypothetical protein